MLPINRNMAFPFYNLSFEKAKQTCIGFIIKKQKKSVKPISGVFFADCADCIQKLRKTVNLTGGKRFLAMVTKRLRNLCGIELWKKKEDRFILDTVQKQDT